MQICCLFPHRQIEKIAASASTNNHTLKLPSQKESFLCIFCFDQGLDSCHSSYQRRWPLARILDSVPALPVPMYFLTSGFLLPCLVFCCQLQLLPLALLKILQSQSNVNKIETRAPLRLWEMRPVAVLPLGCFGFPSRLFIPGAGLTAKVSSR